MKDKGSILIIDDDQFVLLSLQILMEEYFTNVITINDPQQINTILSERAIDVILLDMNFKPGETTGKEGLGWIEKIKSLSPHSSIVILTAYGDIDHAVEAIKHGGFDFLTKPWDNDKLITTTKAAFSLSKSQQQVKKLDQQTKALKKNIQKVNPLIGSSQKMDELRSQIAKIAPSEAIVLITGENGTGKSLVAHAIHLQSHRSNHIFLTVDLGAISPALFESELFGHVKGAFSGAHEETMGKFEAANEGTIFLDEIANISLPLQAKLLQVIQEKKIEKVGSHHSIPIDVRIIAATNQNLLQKVEQGQFREDLLYRLNTIQMEIPSLIDRQEDIQPLAEHFLSVYKAKYGKKGLYVPEYVMTKLAKYPWPGNIRELEHAIEHSVIMSDGKQLHVKDFSLSFTATKTNQTPPERLNLELLEKWAIEQALKKHLGNISQAAAELGLSRGALYRRMEKYDI